MHGIVVATTGYGMGSDEASVAHRLIDGCFAQGSVLPCNPTCFSLPKYRQARPPHRHPPRPRIMRALQHDACPRPGKSETARAPAR